MDANSELIVAWWIGFASHPKEASSGCTGLLCEVEPMFGLALMALGLVIYAGCLCVRDRWWQWL